MTRMDDHAFRELERHREDLIDASYDDDDTEEDDDRREEAEDAPV